MKIVKTKGHDKKGKLIDLFYGTFKVKGERSIETIFTNNYRLEKRARAETENKIKLYGDRVIK